MKLRILRRRSKRNNHGFLKLGRARLRSMSEREFLNLLERLPRGGNHNQRKQVKTQKRLLHLMRYFDENNPARHITKLVKHDSQILDSVYPERVTGWLPKAGRSKTMTVGLSRFSFLDDPVRAMELFREIAICEATALDFKINFDDEMCLDISPYIVLALMRDTMCQNLTGGKIKDGIRTVLEAARIHQKFGIRPTEPSKDKVPVVPFPIVQRRPTGTSTADDRSQFVSTEEETASEFARTVDRWLDMLDVPRQLTSHGKAQIISIIGEVLDNAKRHSDSATWDGSWTIAGFLEARRREDGSITLACHLGIVSLGLSIYESLQYAPDPIKKKVAGYADKHSSFFANRAFDKRALWTAAALQDGVSRVPAIEGSPGGFGMMTLVEMMNALNNSTNPAGRPSLSIVSGDSCVMVRGKHSSFTKSEGNHRIIAFNDDHDLAMPPDEDYVFCLPYRFPGTVVAMRFYLDAQATTDTMI